MNAAPAPAVNAGGIGCGGGCSCGCKPRRQIPRGSIDGALAQGAALYGRFNRFPPSAVSKVRHPRLMPPVVVEIGALAGLIYRSNKGEPGQPSRAYIHIMKDPPRLVSNVEGTRLFIVGGSYRVSRRGIEG
jgi:hypothetical protein